MKKFDVIIGNPPYGSNDTETKTIHFDITEELLNHYNKKMIIIMPNKLAISTTKRFDRYKEKFDKLSEIKDVGCPFIGASVNVGIYVFEKETQNKIHITYNNIVDRYYNNLFEITPFSDYEKTFMNKMCSNEEFAKKFYIPWPNENKVKKYSRLVNIANGAKNGKWFSSIIENCDIFKPNDFIDWYKKHDAQYACISSNSMLEIKNISEAFKRYLLRFALYKVQDDQSMKIRVYEYIPDIDWSDERTKTDEGILEMCGCTKKEAKEFANYCKTYMENIDNTFAEKKKKNKEPK